MRGTQMHAGWSLWTVLGYPAAVWAAMILPIEVEPIGNLVHNPVTSVFAQTFVGGYVVFGIVPMVCLGLLGWVAGRLLVPRAAVSGAFVWTLVAFLANWLVMANMPREAMGPFVFSLALTIPWAMAAVAWWLGTKVGLMSASNKLAEPMA